MVVVGQWTLHYSWGCNGNYGQAEITFKNDGTFQDSFNSTGKWMQVDGMILWQYNNKATYGGNIAGNAMTGLSSTFSGLNGCWYAIKAGTTMLAREEMAEFDTAGNKAKK